MVLVRRVSRNWLRCLRKPYLRLRRLTRYLWIIRILDRFLPVQRPRLCLSYRQ